MLNRHILYIGFWGSMVGEGRGCHHLIEAEAGPPQLSASSVSIERGGETTQMGSF
uniref:Uncharacterized protein n=1 Tax=Nelumbo nucifera TaxID=4432 RepID=A0A822ZI44_NELNU|nr:TPA_asm: hypothetical protein HUJ06_002777 [Nelumbo nucifera]